MVNIYDLRQYKEYLEWAKQKLDNNNYQQFNEIFNDVIYNMEENLKKIGIDRSNPELEVDN
jgi:hypothetical protein